MDSPLNHYWFEMTFLLHESTCFCFYFGCRQDNIKEKNYLIWPKSDANLLKINIPFIFNSTYHIAVLNLQYIFYFPLEEHFAQNCFLSNVCDQNPMLDHLILAFSWFVLYITNLSSSSFFIITVFINCW